VRILQGRVRSRFGYATGNLRTVEGLLLARTGLPSMAPGTLNVQLGQRYIVRADAQIAPDEYFMRETLKLQRCRVHGRRMFIVRPDKHEHARVGPHDGALTLELISPIKLREAWKLKDGDLIEVEVEGDDAWWNAPEPG
jgi:hypothetical protein